MIKSRQSADMKRAAGRLPATVRRAGTASAAASPPEALWDGQAAAQKL